MQSSHHRKLIQAAPQNAAADTNKTNNRAIVEYASPRLSLLQLIALPFDLFTQPRNERLKRLVRRHNASMPFVGVLRRLRHVHPTPLRGNQLVRGRRSVAIRFEQTARDDIATRAIAVAIAQSPKNRPLRVRSATATSPKSSQTPAAQNQRTAAQSDPSPDRTSPRRCRAGTSRRARAGQTASSSAPACAA